MPFSLVADDQFSLAASAQFAYGFPGTDAQRSDRALNFAWPVDGEWTTARVTLRQNGLGVDGEIAGSPSAEFTMLVRRDVERILCLDVDGRGFTDVGRRDPVIGELQNRFPGLRPVLFYTPYEAAAWCIIGHRIRMSQAASVKRRLADDHGVDGAFPDPTRLAALSGCRGLTGQKIDQLHALADAASNGALDRTRLRRLPYDDALQELQRLPGIGPFSAELIMIRGVGAPDAFPQHEKRVHGAVRDAYELSDGADTTSVAEQWRPYRSWVALLLRAGQ